MTNLTELGNLLQQRDHYLIVGHENPDPDSIGSMLGIYQCLRHLGKTCHMMCADALADLSWPNMDKITPFDQAIPYETAIVLDCEPNRTGILASLIKDAPFLINIDHHQGSAHSGDFNYVDTHQAATSMIIFSLAKELSIPISYPIAQPLYGGILGDTGGFRHSNTTTEVLLAAAELVANGARPADTAREIFECKPLEFLKFLGYALGKIQTSHNGRIAWVALSQQDFTTHDVDPANSDQLIQYVRMVAETEIAMLFREVAPLEIRIGFRSHRVNIHTLASHFGGGGHILAAGAKLNGTLPDVVEQVISSANLLLEGEL